jgi:hypothetical protein
VKSSGKYTLLFPSSGYMGQYVALNLSSYLPHYTASHAGRELPSQSLQCESQTPPVLYNEFSYHTAVKHCATSPKVAGLIPDGVTGIFH